MSCCVRCSSITTSNEKTGSHSVYDWAAAFGVQASHALSSATRQNQNLLQVQRTMQDQVKQKRTHPIVRWLIGWLTLTPHFVIGNPFDPYMLRWYVIPRNRFCNVYLHKFLRDDDDRALHDHPWWFISWILWGSYIEHTRRLEWVYLHAEYVPVTERRNWLSVAFRTATTPHRVSLLRSASDPHKCKPCWTLVITGPIVRVWGFHCPQGWRPFDKFVDPNNRGAVGPGCA